VVLLGWVSAPPGPGGGDLSTPWTPTPV